MGKTWLLLAAACVGCRASLPGTPASPGPTCYEADRPLGVSFGGSGEGASPDLARFQLWADGEARRAGLRAARDTPTGWRGDWRRNGDTLHVRLGTCCSGWALALVPEPSTAGPRTYVGAATYGSDVIESGRPAPSMPVRVREAPCLAPAA